MVHVFEQAKKHKKNAIIGVKSMKNRLNENVYINVLPDEFSIF